MKERTEMGKKERKIKRVRGKDSTYSLTSCLVLLLDDAIRFFNSSNVIKPNTVTSYTCTLHVKDTSISFSCRKTDFNNLNTQLENIIK